MPRTNEPTEESVGELMFALTEELPWEDKTQA